jgi:hypothetical protein
MKNITRLPVRMNCERGCQSSIPMGDHGRCVCELNQSSLFEERHVLFDRLVVSIFKQDSNDVKRVF